MNWLILLDGVTQALAYLGLLAVGSVITILLMYGWYYLVDLIDTVLGNF